MQGKFSEVLQDSQESIENKQIGEGRKIVLTKIATDRKFEIKIDGTDYNDNPISVNKSYELFTQALSDTSMSRYIKTDDGYYIDLSELKTGSVTVTYVKDN